jgi:putative membrane protein
VVFVAGALGTLPQGSRDFFVAFTFPVLGFGALWVLWTSRHQAIPLTWLALGFCFVLGFASEWLGVATGWIFGPYVYGTSLGPKFGGVPPLIGLNWVILVWAAYSIWPSASRSFMAALGVVLMDLLMEPGATNLGFWTWQQAPVLRKPWSFLVVAPLQNYLAWGILAWIMLRILGWHYGKAPVVRPSKSALFYAACMLLYFGILLLGNLP